MALTNFVESWVDETAGLTKPSRVMWCDGSKYEYDRLIEQMLADGTIHPLNSRTYPNCYLHRSDPSDVARTEQLTYICTRSRDDDWDHGVFLGSAMGTETTAAITGKVGVVRRDPMAMLPFCGYNMGDYFGHWLGMGARLRTPPRIFRVNWFRRDGSGRFLWPGYGDNVRVLKWIVDRIHGVADARETPIGYVPTPGALELDGLNIAPYRVEAALHVERDEWIESLQDLGEFYRQFGTRLPAAISAGLATTARRLTT